jgi:Leishmanolysin
MSEDPHESREDVFLHVLTYVLLCPPHINTHSRLFLTTKLNSVACLSKLQSETTMTSHGCRKRPYCFALVTAASVATIAAHVPQHRVKHPLKGVFYGHVITQSQKERVLPFLPVDFVPGATPSQNSASFWHEESDQSWHLHCNAALVSPETVLNRRKKMPENRMRRRRTEETTSAFSAQQTLVRASPSSTENLDSLLSQVGADNSSATSSWNISTVLVFAPINTTSSSATSSWNISTEVEFAQINTTSSNATSNVTASVVYSTSASMDNPTSTPYQPMRIRAILTENSWLSTGDTSILFQDILSPAILAWSAALRVDPVVGNLTIHADQLYDGETCGPGKHSGYPSATVPLLHLESGIPDTDFVIYLSLAFSDGTIDPRNTTNNIQVNSSSVDPNTSYGEGANDFSTTTAQGSKINLTDALFGDTVGGTDFGLPNVSVKPTCTGDYLAAATYCSTDQYDRPTAAMLHLCIDEHSFSTNIPKTIVTVMHEIGHALGFNPQSLAHFRTQDGRPVTERDDDGNVVDVKVKCTGVDQETEVIPLPSKDILQFRRVRNGVRVAEIVTPTVRQVVRNHFDCQGLQGAELESGIGDTEGSCLGDHWERRLFREDLMNPIVDEVPFSLRISPLTLALFADSGWYQVDLSRSTYPAAWGRGTGCPFVNETCIDREDGSVTAANAPFFCNNIVVPKGLIHEIHGCSPDMTRKAICSIAQYDSELPSQYQYFGATFGVNYGGKEEYLDYCPVFSGFSNGECMARKNALVMKVSPLEDFGSTNSRCLTGLFQGIQTALCLQIACVVQDQTLRVKVDGTWRLCTRAGEELLIESDPNMVVTCPDPVRTCPTFYCNRDCLGTSGGICDFHTGDCMCSVQMANSTAANGTNATIFIPCEKVEAVKQDANEAMLFGVTKYEYDLLSDAPFPDYYVPTSHDLENDRTSIMGTVGIILVCSGVFVLLLFVSMGAWRYLPSGGFDAGTEVLRRFRIADANGPDVPEEIEVTRNNKDKFVASMLLNLRLHYPQLQSQDSVVSELENYSETESSVTENSARFSMPSSNTDSDNDIDTSNRELHTVQTQEEEVHPVMVIRRRFKAGDV